MYVIVSLTDVTGERDLTGLGQIWEGSSGKSGSGGRAHLSASSLRGPGADQLFEQGAVGQGPSRPWRLSVQVSGEELLLVSRSPGQWRGAAAGTRKPKG